MPAANDAFAFWENMTTDPISRCWEWGGYKNAGGYGRVGWRGAKVMAHRLAWELANGPIPDGLRVLHHCDNRICCNPAHLFLGTQVDNIADMVAKGRGANRLTHAARPTHCPQGHAYNGHRRRSNGKLHCMTCDAARSRRYYAAHAERIKAEKRYRRRGFIVPQGEELVGWIE